MWGLQPWAGLGQPFYRSDRHGWTKLTYGDKPLDYAVKALRFFLFPRVRGFLVEYVLFFFFVGSIAVRGILAQEFCGRLMVSVKAALACASACLA